MAYIQGHPNESTFSDYVSKQTIDFNDTFSEDTAYPLSDLELQERPKVYEEIEEALSKLQNYLTTPELDQDYINNFTNYMSQIMSAKRAQSPREQFNYLYHLRKLLLWAPVSILSARGGDIQSLLVLAYFYAVALRLEPAFPDVGAAYLGNLVLNPLEEILAVLHLCQSNPNYASMEQTTAILIEFPQNAVDEYRSRRQWSSRQSGIQPSIQHTYELSSISTDLGNQFTTGYSYTPSLSPAFASPSPHIVSPQVSSAQTPRSPFLQVPGSGVESYSYGSYSPGASYQPTPVSSTFGGSPLLSPGYKSPLQDYQISQSDFTPTILTTDMNTSESGVMGNSAYSPYSISPSVSSAGLGYSGGAAGAAGGCVVPTAVWT
jgi:hypothetical protein